LRKFLPKEGSQQKVPQRVTNLGPSKGGGGCSEKLAYREQIPQILG